MTIQYLCSGSTKHECFCEHVGKTSSSSEIVVFLLEIDKLTGGKQQENEEYPVDADKPDIPNNWQAEKNTTVRKVTLVLISVEKMVFPHSDKFRHWTTSGCGINRNAVEGQSTVPLGPHGNY